MDPSFPTQVPIETIVSKLHWIPPRSLFESLQLENVTDVLMAKGRASKIQSGRNTWEKRHQT